MTIEDSLTQPRTYLLEGWGHWKSEGIQRDGWMMGLRGGFININDMYNNDVGKGVVYAYEACEVK